MTVSVCIATFRRPDRLAALLNDLMYQTCRPDQIVVVDNDAAGSARSIVASHPVIGSPIPLVYDIQAERNISMTRNRTVHLAHCDWLAFIDDDERAPEDWLRLLVDAAERYDADGVLAPVDPKVPETAPSWIRRGRFYEWPRLPNGTPVPRSNLRFGNVLLRASLMRSEPGPFDTSFGLSTGEDGDLLMRLMDRGAKIVWCDDAIVWEPVEPKRLSLRWLMQRALSGGQHFARLRLRGRYRRVNTFARVAMLLQWSAQMLVAIALAAASLPIGRHRAVSWLIKASANLGKLTAFSAWRYGEYA